MKLLRQIAESFTAFCDHFGIPLFPHQRDDFGAATARKDGRFVHQLAGVSWPRGDAKSYSSAAVGVWRLVTGRPGTLVVTVALDLNGTDVILEHARRHIRHHPALEAAIEVRANEFLVSATGSRWVVGSREHTSTRGLHPDVVLADEYDWSVSREHFASLLAAQASVPDPFTLVTSTVAQRDGVLRTIRRLAEAGDSAVCWRWSGVNRSPLVTPAFLARQQRILLPGQYAREHENRLIDGADSFTTQVFVDAAMDRAWVEQVIVAIEDALEDSVIFVDLGTVKDPTVIALGFERGGLIYLARLITFQGSAEAPVQLADVEGTLKELLHTWRVTKIRIESWQGVAAVQALQRLGAPVELFHPTAKAHGEEWPLLAQALAAGRLVLFPHARLREELLNLTYEVGPSGVKVIDRGRIHQDHAVAVRGVVAMLAARSSGAGPTLDPPDDDNALVNWKPLYY